MIIETILLAIKPIEAFVDPFTLMAIGTAIKGIDAYMSYGQQKEAEKKAAELAAKPVAQYSPTGQLQSYAEAAMGGFATPRGLSSAERSRWTGNIEKSLAANRYNALQAGGGQTASAISRMGNLGELDALGSLEGADANARRASEQFYFGQVGNAARDFQRLKDANTGTSLQRRLMAERGLADAIRSNRDRWQGQLSSMGGDFLQAGAYGQADKLATARMDKQAGIDQKRLDATLAAFGKRNEVGGGAGKIPDAGVQRTEIPSIRTESPDGLNWNDGFYGMPPIDQTMGADAPYFGSDYNSMLQNYNESLSPIKRGDFGYNYLKRGR